MNRGLLHKSVREIWVGTLLFCLGVFGAELLFAHVLPDLYAQFSKHIAKLPFVKVILSGLLGSELGEHIHPLTYVSVAWVHPFVLALLWGHELLLCTRVPAGQIDSGVADVVLGMPVSRWQVYLSETLLWLVSGVLIILSGLLGFGLGLVGKQPEFRPDFSQLLIVCVNLFMLYFAVGGFAFLCSTLSDFRGRAIGMVFGLVLASFLLNFLAKYWEPAGKISFLGVLSYYQPHAVIVDGGWPVGDILVLGVAGVILWGVGGVVFHRRNICTI